MTGNVQVAGAVLGEHACFLAGEEYFGENLPQLPGIAFRGHQLVKGRDAFLVKVLGFGVDGHHAGSIAHAQHLVAGEFPVDIARQGGEKHHVLHMRLPVQDALIQVRQAPAEGHVEVEQGAEFLGRGTGVGVAPGAEGNQELVGAVEGHIAVHHGADTNGGEAGDFRVVMDADVLAEVAVALLQAGPDGV